MKKVLAINVEYKGNYFISNTDKIPVLDGVIQWPIQKLKN